MKEDQKMLSKRYKDLAGDQQDEGGGDGGKAKGLVKAKKRYKLFEEVI